MSSDGSSSHTGRPEGAKDLVFFTGLLALLVSVGCSSGTNLTNSGGNASGGGGGPVAASVNVTIPVGTAPVGIAVDSTNDKIYVADFGVMPTSSSDSQPCLPTGADVMVIDGATQSTVAAGFPLSLPNSNPTYLAFNSVTHTVNVAAFEYGASNGTGCRNDFDDVLSIDPSNPSAAGSIYHAAVLRTATMGGIAVDQNSGNIYLGEGTSEEGASFSFITALDDTGTMKAEIGVGSLPLAIALDTNPGASTIYAGTSGIFGYNKPSVSVIDQATNTVTATILDPNAGGSITIAFNPTTNTIYAANEQSNNVSVIDAATRTVTANIAVGNSPTGIAVNPKTNFIYVANSGFQHANDRGSVTVIDGKTNATTTLTDPNAIGPGSVAVNPLTNKVYVTNRSNNVTVIDGAHE